MNQPSRESFRAKSYDEPAAPRPLPRIRGSIKTDQGNHRVDLSIYNFSHEPWRADAACIEHPDPGIFFPSQSEDSRTEASRGKAEALDICRSCYVRWDCLGAATRQPHGIFGGYDGDERRKIKRKVQTARRLGEEDLADAVVEEGMRMEMFRLKGQEKRRSWK